MHDSNQGFKNNISLDTYGAPYSPPISTHPYPSSDRVPKYEDSYGAPLSPPLDYGFFTVSGSYPVSDSYGSPIPPTTPPSFYPQDPQIFDNADPTWNNPLLEAKSPALNTPYKPPVYSTTPTPLVFPTSVPRLNPYPEPKPGSGSCCPILRVHLVGECLTHQPGKTGEFINCGAWNGFPVYKQETGDNFMFWEEGKNWSGWIIGRFNSNKSLGRVGHLKYKQTSFFFTSTFRNTLKKLKVRHNV